MEKIPLWLFERNRTGRQNAFLVLGNRFHIFEPSNNVDIFLGHLQGGLDAGMMPPLVLLLDLCLDSNRADHYSPETGLRLIREAKRLCPNLLIVVWTKHSEDVRQKALEAGADMQYAKYVNDEKMSEEIMNFLEKRRTKNAVE